MNNIDFFPAKTEKSEPALSYIVEAAVSLVAANYMSLYGVSELADALAVNKSYLIRIFKRETGVTPGQYLIMTRIAKSKELLADAGCTVEMAARLSGFSSVSYFSRIFKRFNGESPSAFRRHTAPRENFDDIAELYLSEL